MMEICVPRLERVEHLHPDCGRPLEGAIDLEPQLPAELMRQEPADRLEGLAGFQLLQPERVTDRVGLAVPIRPLQDLDGHGARDTLPVAAVASRSASGLRLPLPLTPSLRPKHCA